jgi:hypothetical protein
VSYLFHFLPARCLFVRAATFAVLASTGALAAPPNPTASDGNLNTAGGSGALAVVGAGYANTAFGAYALQFNAVGYSNTAIGSNSLAKNLGSANTAVGSEAMTSNSTGVGNTATGNWSLYSNSTGRDNTASGFSSLGANTTGSSNTGSGSQVLYSNSTGYNNTAAGFNSLFNNTTGFHNTATGSSALQNSTTGAFNVAVGSAALETSSTGSSNTAVGPFSLRSNTSGSVNTALGALAGYNLTTGSYNIHIANSGFAADTKTTRIGDGNQTRTFISGIAGVTLSGGGSTVLVNAGGQLGTVASSARYKQGIADIGDGSAKLFELRPVAFQYKADPAQEKQYGLIAEEVAQVYPELVVRNENGEIESVRYHELAPMLLNEMQKQHKLIRQQSEAIGALTARLARLEANARGSAATKGR